MSEFKNDQTDEFYGNMDEHVCKLGRGPFVNVPYKFLNAKFSRSQIPLKPGTRIVYQGVLFQVCGTLYFHDEKADEPYKYVLQEMPGGVD